MLKVRFMSDIHSEFDGLTGVFTIPVNKDDKDTVLILSGDVGVVKSPVTLTKIFDQLSRFKRVLMCMGNHEHYGYSFIKTENKIKEILEKYDNIFLLENDFNIVNDVAFIGATLWANFDNENVLVMQDCLRGMNDYYKIRTGLSLVDAYKYPLTPQDVLAVHNKSVAYIFDSIKFHKAEGRKVVVFTHNGPSKQSIHAMYRSEQLNGAYVTDLEDRIIETEPDFWIHGHVHASFEYIIGKTNIVVNPRGYSGYELNPNFNPNRNFEV